MRGQLDGSRPLGHSAWRDNPQFVLQSESGQKTRAWVVIKAVGGSAVWQHIDFRVVGNPDSLCSDVGLRWHQVLPGCTIVSKPTISAGVASAEVELNAEPLFVVPSTKALAGAAFELTVLTAGAVELSLAAKPPRCALAGQWSEADGSAGGAGDVSGNPQFKLWVTQTHQTNGHGDSSDALTAPVCVALRRKSREACWRWNGGKLRRRACTLRPTTSLVLV